MVGGVGELVLLAEEEVVVPLEDVFVLVEEGVGAEVDFADFAAPAGVSADGNDEALIGAGGGVGGVIAEAHVVAQRALEEDVVPGGDGEGGHLNVLVVLFDGPLAPVVVVVGVGGPVEEVGREVGGGGGSFFRRADVENGELGEWQDGRADEGVNCGGWWEGFVVAQGRVLYEAAGPGLIEPLLECAALVGPVFVVVGGGDDGADAGEVGRFADGGEHLGCADVGAGEHADFSVGVRQGGGPFNGVVAVVGFVLEGVPLALGGVAAADVLSDDHEAVLDGFGAKGGEAVLVVGGADEEDVEGTITGGAVDVGEEGDAVAGFHGDVFFDDDGGGDDVGCGLSGGDERSSGKGSEAEELFEHGNSGRLRTGKLYRDRGTGGLRD
jgi:hypothetical protein